MIEVINLPPDAHNFLQGARNTGYTLNTALADIIDNSIAACATDIKIFADTDIICVIDNGTGMDKPTLHQAMRLGSKDPLASRVKTDLGRFGLGLNMASISMCDKTTVISRMDGTENAITLDLKHIDSSRSGGTSSWEYIVPDQEYISSIFNVDKLEDNGTMVIWEDLVGLNLPPRELPEYEDRYNELLSNVKNHLSLVYHRFLNGSDGTAHCNIEFNYDNLQGFDPFVSDLSIPHPPEPQKFEDILFQAFTLPHPSRVNMEEWKKYGMTDGYLHNQGLYIYRSNRLIMWGTWLNLRTRQERSKLCRVKIDLPNTVESDKRWGITVDKAKAAVPDTFRRKLTGRGGVLENLTGNSSRVLRGRGNRRTQEAILPLWEQQDEHGNLNFKINTDHPLVNKLILDSDIEGIISFIEHNLPANEIYAHMSEFPSNSDTPTSDDPEEIQKIVTFLYDHFLNEGNSLDQILIELQALPILARNWETSRHILAEEYQINASI